MTEEEFEKFKKKLEETTSFPSVYMFKFIIKSENRNIALVENLFGPESDILTKESEKGKYTSITARQVVMNVEEIIEIYKRASVIKGIIFL
jgi:putative lipoic acid-binding regulatory protein